MPQQPRAPRFFAVFCALPLLCLCAVGCDVEPASVLSQDPTCPTDGNTVALKIEGSIAGGSIDDERTANISAGWVNTGMPKFFTPISDSEPLEANQIALTIDWGVSLLPGRTADLTGGRLTLPANHPDPGARFCVSAGTVGIVDGGREDGAIKFDVTEVKAGADCSGAATSADLRGCYQ
jgi:hypothetical protein